jgi:hypothetical protein
VIWPIIASRLQSQHLPFWLHTLSNTPSVKNWGYNWDLLANFRWWNVFSILQLSILRSVWTNRHNSRHVCNLEELINQSKLTCDLPSNTRNQELMRVCDMKGVTWWAKRALGITLWSQKFDVASRYTHLEGTNETSGSNKVVKNIFKVILYIYILAPS